MLLTGRNKHGGSTSPDELCHQNLYYKNNLKTFPRTVGVRQASGREKYGKTIKKMIRVRRAIIADITIPHDDNLVTAEKDKVSKYLDLAHEITAMWNVESTVPIVVSVTGLLAKNFDQHLKKLSLGCWINGRIQKAVVLETARIVRRFLSLEP
ncbi:jg22610 [Pararge aegeria aegeria]|uniref:Jg22610 protein n=1 Tax=Pararge aegeria aegeria TaxID=348720 RepID=A0A8S4SH88_9NEOP|nr:jg22610 [Pararge aegeria aegeria]